MQKVIIRGEQTMDVKQETDNKTEEMIYTFEDRRTGDIQVSDGVHTMDELYQMLEAKDPSMSPWHILWLIPIALFIWYKRR